MKRGGDLENVNMAHRLQSFPPVRLGVEDLMWAGAQKHIVHGLGEIDISKVRAWFRDQKEKEGENLSFTAYVIKCLAKAVEDYKFMHAYRMKKDKVVIFDDVDINVIVERDHPAIEGKKMPTTYIVRAANTKSFRQINDEIRNAQKADLQKGPKANRGNIYLKLPRFIRHAIWRRILKDPFYHKKIAGTVGLTAIGMFEKGYAGFAIPITPSTLTMTLGGIYERPTVVNGKIEIREVMCVTMSVDHDVVDGGPATRFMVKFGELMRDGFGLNES